MPLMQQNFATKKTLVDHSRTHTGERPFVW